ncbi:MAG TPA: multidrug efflux SMR transporter [Phytomonospora sp.]
MAWPILLLSALFEAVWATALGRSDGLTDPLPTTVFAAALVVSMGGLGWALKTIPIGTAYAVWTGLGAALTVGYAMATGAEAVSVWKLVFIGGIVGSVAGLKLLKPKAAESPGRAPSPPPSDA